VALSAPGGVQITRYRSGDPPLEEILDTLAPESDLILVEVYKIGPLPKILLVGNQLETVLTDSSQVIALVSADPIDSDLPVFHPRQVSEIGGFLRKYLGGELCRKLD
jgi:molybdopterin-guanine dinucleotide biosynthesis protein MobB